MCGVECVECVECAVWSDSQVILRCGHGVPQY